MLEELQLGPQHLRQYQAYLFQERKLDAGTVQQHVAALRFFYVKTLKRRYLLEDLPRPKQRRKLPEILSPEEVARLIDSASNLFHRTMLTTLYSTGVRRSELCRLLVTDIDSQRMIVHIRQGKGGHDRDVPLSEKLLDTLRIYWRWMKPKRYLFPGTVKNWRADVPVTSKVPWQACRQAAKRAGITKRIGPHTLRHYAASGTMRHQMDFPSYYKGAATHIRGIVWCVLLLTTLVGQDGIPCKSFSRIHAQSNVCAEGRSATT
jgi:site-specific recombinase XerD